MVRPPAAAEATPLRLRAGRSRRAPGLLPGRVPQDEVNLWRNEEKPHAEERRQGLGGASRSTRAGFPQIGRASCRERVCQYVSISVVAVSLKKKKTYNTQRT